MKLKCRQTDLSKGLGIVGKAAAHRSHLPVLANVLLEAEDGTLRLAATNLEVGISLRVPAIAETEGATTVPARLLADLVGRLPDDAIELELTGETQTLSAHCGKFRANVKGIGADEFPIVPTWAGTEAGADLVATLDAEDFRQAVELVAFAAAGKDDRPILTGVLMRFEEERFTMVSADGYRMSVLGAEVNAKVMYGRFEPETAKVLPDGMVIKAGNTGYDEEEGEVVRRVDAVVPAETLADVGKLARGADRVKIALTGSRNQVVFNVGDVDVVSQLIEGRFPDYTRIIPKNHAIKVAVGRGALLEALKVAYLFAREVAGIVTLDVRPEGVHLNAVSAEYGDSQGFVEGEVEGIEEDEGLHIAFNGKYLIEILEKLNSPRVWLGMGDASAPCTIKASGDRLSGFLHVIMPMHLADVPEKKEAEEGAEEE